MKFLLIGAIVFVVVYIVFIHPIRQAIQISTTIIDTTEPYEQTPENPVARILVAGDSTAYGTGAADSRYSIAGRIGQLYPDASITNVSINGLRLAGLNELLKKHSADRYDLIVFQIGANDVTGFTSQADVKTELRNALSYAQVQADSTIVITSGNVGLSPVFHPPLSQLLSWRTRVVRSIFMETVAEYETATYVDLYKDKANDEFSTDINRYYAPDLFHPSGDGYGLWFREVEPVLKAKLGE